MSASHVSGSERPKNASHLRGRPRRAPFSVGGTCRRGSSSHGYFVEPGTEIANAFTKMTEPSMMARQGDAQTAGYSDMILALKADTLDRQMSRQMIAHDDSQLLEHSLHACGPVSEPSSTHGPSDPTRYMQTISENQRSVENRLDSTSQLVRQERLPSTTASSALPLIKGVHGLQAYATRALMESFEYHVTRKTSWEDWIEALVTYPRWIQDKVWDELEVQYPSTMATRFMREIAHRDKVPEPHVVEVKYSLDENPLERPGLDLKRVTTLRLDSVDTYRVDLLVQLIVVLIKRSRLHTVIMDNTSIKCSSIVKLFAKLGTRLKTMTTTGKSRLLPEEVDLLTTKCPHLVLNGVAVRLSAESSDAQSTRHDTNTDKSAGEKTFTPSSPSFPST